MFVGVFAVICKIIDGGNPKTDTIRWDITDEDGVILTSESREFSFISDSEVTSGFFGYAISDTRAIVISIVSLSILVAISLLVLARRRSDGEEKYEDERYHQEVVSGPPVSGTVQPQVVQPLAEANDWTWDGIAGSWQPPPQSSITGGQVAEEIIDGYTVSQLRAGGWSEEQIEWKRKSRTSLGIVITDPIMIL